MKGALLFFAALVAVAAGLTPHRIWKELWET